MRFLKDYQEDEPVIQMAPMVDVILNLLIFFIVITAYARMENELSITVPTAEMSQPPKRSPGELIINLKNDGSVVINQKLITPDQLKILLTRVAKQYPDQFIIIRGDRLTAFENAIGILDLCAKCGIWNVSFAALPPENKTKKS